MRSRITDFLIVSISHQNEFDHSFDHLRLRTTWKQCPQEHPKASFSDSKAPKSLVNQGKNRLRFLWDFDAAGSSPVTPTKRPPLSFCSTECVSIEGIGLFNRRRKRIPAGILSVSRARRAKHEQSSSPVTRTIFAVLTAKSKPQGPPCGFCITRNPIFKMRYSSYGRKEILDR